MSLSQETVIHINPTKDTIMVETVEKGIKSCKQVALGTLIDCIRQSLSREMTGSGLLPQGCLSFATGEDDWHSVSILHGERYADISYMGTEYLKFPLPRLVFKFGLTKGLRVQSCSMGVVGEGLLTPDTPMYHYPLSNVIGYSLCVGNNVLPKCESLHTLGSLPYYILSMPNNNDHFKPEHNKPKLEMRDLLEHLRDKDPSDYYSDILISNSQTLKQFISEGGNHNVR